MPLLDEPVVAALGSDLAPEQLARLPHSEVADVDDLLNLAPRLGQDLAVLQADEPREVLLALPEAIAESPHDLATLWRGNEAPLRERFVCGADRALHFVRGRRTDVSQHLAGGRV